jgi:hypothetical protein
MKAMKAYDVTGDEIWRKSTAHFTIHESPQGDAPQPATFLLIHFFINLFTSPVHS